MNNTMSNSTGNSYGSITPAMDANASVDVNASTPTPRSSSSSSRRQSHRRGPSMLKVMLGASACLCGMMILIATNMDSEMYDKFQALGFSVSHMRAQLTADKVHLNTPLLSRGSSFTGSKKQKKQQDHEQQHPHAPEGCEGTVLLIRHCEKLNLKSHCDYVGFERSVFLATLFGHTVKDRWPAPSTLYALRPGHRHNPHKMNYRELETVDAIADKFELQVNDDYSTHATGQLARDVLETVKQGDICGKLVVVSWKHSDLPNLARKLGKNRKNGDNVVEREAAMWKRA
jgi:hypothetical protein